MVKTVNASPLVCAFKGALVSLLISLLSMPISAWILLKADDPGILIFVLPKALQIISAIIGGIVIAKCRGSNGILTSLIGGAIYSAVIIIGGLIMSSSAVTMIIMIALIFLSFVLGDVIGVPKEKSTSSKRKEMMKRLK